MAGRSSIASGRGRLRRQRGSCGLVQCVSCRLKLHDGLCLLIMYGRLSHYLRLGAVISRLRFGGGVRIGEPVTRSRSFAFRNFKKGFLNLFGYRTASSRTDRYAVNGTDWCDLGGGAGEEEFIGDIKRRALNASFFDRNSQLLANLNHAVASNAGQD